MGAIRAQSFLGIEIPAQRIPSLDGLRAVSIALVLWSHFSIQWPWGTRLAHQWTGDLGPLGVRIFFVISGFLITSLLLAEQRRTGRISLQMFYFRRTMRIFPAFYAYLAAMAAATALKLVDIPLPDFGYALAYVMNFVAEPNWNLGHLWSLAVEEQFYLLWPATFAFFGPGTAFRAAAAVVLLSPLIRFACMYNPVTDPLIGLAFPTIADPLAIGCLLAGMREWLGKQPFYTSFLQSRRFYLLPPAIFVLNILPGTKLRMLLTQSVLNICIAVLIDGWTRFPAGRFAAFLNWKPLRAMGVLSYSLYLWQQPFLNPRSHAMFNQFPLSLAASFACAYISYRVIEKPLLNLRASLEQRWKERTAVAARNVPLLAGEAGTRRPLAS